MLRMSTIALVAGAIMLTAPQALAADGKGLFVQQECNACHTITSQAIEALPPAEGEDAPKITDLSEVGKTRDAVWIKGWLLRTVEKTKTRKSGKVKKYTHKKKFKGSEAEAQLIADWLATLK